MAKNVKNNMFAINVIEDAISIIEKIGLKYEVEDSCVIHSDVGIFTFEKEGNIICGPSTGGLLKGRYSRKSFEKLVDYCRYLAHRKNTLFIEGISELTICRSAAGYYIGRLEIDDYGDGEVYIPYSRESGYFSCFDNAYKALINNNY